LGAQVVQHQEGNVADFFKAVFKGRGWIAIGVTQPVQQVGDGQEQGGDTAADNLVGNCGCQVRLAAAVRATKYQPANQIICIILRHVHGFCQRCLLLNASARTTIRVKGFKCHSSEGTQVGCIKQVRQPAAQDGILPAFARVHLAKIRVVDRYVAA